MKTTNFYPTYLTLAFIFIIILASSFIQPPPGNTCITMRTLEAAAGGSTMVIVFEDGKTEELELDKLRANNMLPNAVRINQAVNKITSMGYSLVGVSGGDYISTYTFQKK